VDKDEHGWNNLYLGSSHQRLQVVEWHHGNLGSGKIAPFQAFWVKANAASPSLKCNNGVKTSGGSFLGKIAAGDGKLVSVSSDSTGQKNTNIAE